MAVAVALGGAACTQTDRTRVVTTPPPSGGSLGIMAPRITGWLTTDGTRIVDQRGRTVRLLSINVKGMNQGSGTALADLPAGTLGCLGWSAPPDSEFRNIQAWGFNSVRLTVSWSNLEPVAPTLGVNGDLEHHYNQPYVDTLTAIVQRFQQMGIGVVISMQQNKWSPAFPRVIDGVVSQCPGTGFPSWLYEGTGISNIKQAKIAFFSDQSGVQSWFSDAWRYLAGRFADDPTVVGFDMLNEPYPPPAVPPADIRLNDLYARVGSAIRDADPKALLIFEDTADKGDGVFGLSGPPPFHGVVYSFHLYRPTWNPDGLQVTQDFQRRADAWGVPMWVGEFNLFGAMKNPPATGDWVTSSQQMLAYLKSNGISWAVFAYSGQSSLIVPNTDHPKPGLLPILQRGF
jgi:endoglycosylceramidase